MKDVLGVWGACLFLWGACYGGVVLVDRLEQSVEETDTFVEAACYPDVEDL